MAAALKPRVNQTQTRQCPQKPAHAAVCQAAGGCASCAGAGAWTHGVGERCRRRVSTLLRAYRCHRHFVFCVRVSVRVLGRLGFARVRVSATVPPSTAGVWSRLVDAFAPTHSASAVPLPTRDEQLGSVVPLAPSRAAPCPARPLPQGRKRMGNSDSMKTA